MNQAPEAVISYNTTQLLISTGLHKPQLNLILN
jgi:hypothetical protein